MSRVINRKPGDFELGEEAGHRFDRLPLLSARSNALQSASPLPPWTGLEQEQVQEGSGVP